MPRVTQRHSGLHNLRVCLMSKNNTASRRNRPKRQNIKQWTSENRDTTHTTTQSLLFPSSTASTKPFPNRTHTRTKIVTQHVRPQATQRRCGVNHPLNRIPVSNLTAPPLPLSLLLSSHHRGVAEGTAAAAAARCSSLRVEVAGARH